MRWLPSLLIALLTALVLSPHLAHLHAGGATHAGGSATAGADASALHATERHSPADYAVKGFDDPHLLAAIFPPHAVV